VHTFSIAAHVFAVIGMTEDSFFSTKWHSKVGDEATRSGWIF
jgi:hypothetical protein